nr:endolytic transglycosylase MltG [Candidatus Magasanikbacteria bacterium]
HEVYVLLGKPAEYAIPNISPTKISWIASKPSRVSLEGYLAPDTYSIYNNATLEEVVDKLLTHREDQLLPLMPEIVKSGRSLHEIMTMAALLEREVRTPKDKAIVADIFWKRHDVNMGLQADSTVHYATAKEGSVFTSNADRASANPWNTYKYPGLPPGPIATPSLASIEAAIRPTKNDYWYFLTTLDTGEVKYGKTLAEHNANVQKYLR